MRYLQGGNNIMYILGIWDGHDAGTAIIKGNKILEYVN